jgi:gliding motility-associated-like protein
VYALPQIHLPENEFAFCAMQPVGISAEVSVEAPSVIANCAWSVDGEIVSTENPAQFQATELGAYVVDVKATSNHGCETIASLDQPIVIYPNPTAGFTWTLDQLTESPSVQLIANASADVTSIGYNWGDGSSDEETTHTYSTDGTYEITQVVTNSFGCNAYYSETVEAFNGLQFYIPSAFTPDQNNHNEAFLPVVSGSFISYYVFRVFNRWGIEVFASTIPGEGWDGTYHGEPVQDGAYNWSVDMIVRGREDLFVKKGSVLLMR